MYDSSASSSDPPAMYYASVSNCGRVVCHKYKLQFRELSLALTLITIPLL